MTKIRLKKAATTAAAPVKKKNLSTSIDSHITEFYCRMVEHIIAIILTKTYTLKSKNEREILYYICCNRYDQFDSHRFAFEIETHASQIDEEYPYP